MTKDQTKYYRLIRQLRDWTDRVHIILDIARDDHWLIRHHKGALIDDLRRLADRLEKADAKREKEAA